jgi:hypothetical protein
MHRAARIALAALVCLAAGVAGAQEPKSYRLLLKEYKEVAKGKAAFVEGRAKPGGDRFFVEHLSILQPVVVSVKALDPKAADLKLQLSKYRFDEADQRATTSDGVATLRVRTQGEMKIVVSGANDAPYYLAVWAGDELMPEMKPVVVRRRAAVQGGGSWSLTTAAGIAGGVLVGGAAVFVLGRRKRK